jgi:hypothetical protein
MGRFLPEMIREFGKNVQAMAGKEVGAEVLEGCEEITTRADSVGAARWMRDAVGRLDRLTNEKTRRGIMERCGTACIRANGVFIPQVKARRKKYASEDEFLSAEAKKPLTGTKLERKGNVLYHTYTPFAFTPPMRCYCPLVRALPDKENISPTYCQCSKAFLRAFWEAALGRPLKVEVLETALSGSRECRFRIEI